MNAAVNTDEQKGAGLHLRILRLKAGLRQFEVAAQMGLHPGREAIESTGEFIVLMPFPM